MKTITTNEKLASVLSVVYLLEMLSIKAAAAFDEDLMSVEITRSPVNSPCKCGYCRRTKYVGFTLDGNE